jgi:hypothetical protein
MQMLPWRSDAAFPSFQRPISRTRVWDCGKTNQKRLLIKYKAYDVINETLLNLSLSRWLNFSLTSGGGKKIYFFLERKEVNQVKGIRFS